MIWRVILLATIIVAVASGSARSGNSTANSCGPYGDPSAAVFSAVKPHCGKGKLLGPWKDGDGIDRYACLYAPARAASNRKLPMLVYLHPSLFGAGWITRTNILDYQNSVSLSDDPTNIGYIVLAPQGRKTTHYYPFPDNKGIGWDNWYRQLTPAGDVRIGKTTWRENADAAAIDHFIAMEVASGAVDTKRIYMSGWSNGAAMAYLYALNRPGIAAVAVYSAPNPFGAFEDPCQQRPVVGAAADNARIQIFNPTIPTMHIHNSCDTAGICPNSERLTSELLAAGVSVEDIILDDRGNRVNGCNTTCGSNPNAGFVLLSNPIISMLGMMNHAQWPKAWTLKMFDFFRKRPLKTQPN
ncbi:MAG TPA: PHB depolymerase family esterase [Sporolactobacillaceae bacterium]|nr:PHB depolymerase family esterase [Sporolactobacillaceae bacterium]